MGKRKSAPFSGQQIVSKNSIAAIFPTFFLIKRVSKTNETFHSVSPFLVEKRITGNIGEVKCTKKLRSGDLLVEVLSRKQSQHTMKLKSFGDIQITVSPHVSLNSSKGVISCGEMFNDEKEEILKELKSQGGSHVRRISIRRNGELHKKKYLILTYGFPKLPEYIKAGYMRLPVRPYIPSPLRCFKCQRFGHSKTSCRGTLTCARCADVGHDSSQCNSVEKCVNCKGAHTSYSRNCPTWLLEKEVISTKIKNQISFTEARKLVKSQSPTGTSYASIAQTKTKQSKSFNISNNSLALEKSVAISDIQSSSNSTKLSITQNESVSVPPCDVATASQDLPDFQLVTKKKKYKKKL
ncbi:uncharacterized protein LOC129972035 [Argiope bruennichi]|uniref:uncharacterized protein LOC129972035 n=1 Tax=Argiope bruennichi TaxID=94029 RepID=UPI002494E87D|nr:uncharacterized protein LOC129972035 [Argiope bruennichi]